MNCLEATVLALLRESGSMSLTQLQVATSADDLELSQVLRPLIRRGELLRDHSPDGIRYRFVGQKLPVSSEVAELYTLLRLRGPMHMREIRVALDASRQACSMRVQRARRAGVIKCIKAAGTHHAVYACADQDTSLWDVAAAINRAVPAAAPDPKPIPTLHVLAADPLPMRFTLPPLPQPQALAQRMAELWSEVEDLAEDSAEARLPRDVIDDLRGAAIRLHRAANQQPRRVA